MADYFRILQQQLAAKIEAIAGTFENLAATEVKLRPFQSEFSYTPDRMRFANDEVAEDIGQAVDFTAGAKASIGVGFALKTAGVVGTIPAIAPYLRGCGMQAEVVHAITIGAPTGGAASFVEGDPYTIGAGGKTGTIEQTISAGGSLHYVPITGGALASADVVTVGSCTATASSADALYAYKFRPRSTSQSTLSVRRGIKNSVGTASEDYLTIIKGAMGDGSLELTALDIARFKGTFTGVIHSEAAGAFFSGYTYETGTPPTFTNATVQINGVAVHPDNISLAFGNAVEMDPDPTTGGGAAGYSVANISGRKPTLTITPYRQTPTVLDDLGIHASGATATLLVRFGVTPQIIEIVAPHAQLTGWAPGNRAGLETAALTFALTRDALVDNEYAIYFR
ncbi:MAG: hypothetical protein V2A73_21355 [Pseudomonadota bacterium]